MRIIMCLFLLLSANFGFCQNIGILQEGYHTPGYIPTTTIQNTSNDKSKSTQSSLELEAAAQKNSYDKCMIEFKSIKGDSFDDKFNRAAKIKECDQYYNRYLDIIKMSGN